MRDDSKPARRARPKSGREAAVGRAVIESALAVEAGRAADKVLKALFDRRRWEDRERAAVARLTLALSRYRRQLDWWTERAGTTPSTLARLTAALTLIDGCDRNKVERYLPQLPPPERRVLEAASGHTLHHPDQPRGVANNLPDWLLVPLARRFGERLDAELPALVAEAGLDLRVNTLKARRDEAAEALKAEGIAALPGRFSPCGLRVGGRPALARTAAWRSGGFEVQDEASQIAALLVGARPGERILDLCAGAGGKTLALAAVMENKGRLVASDVNARRLDQARLRLRRAGVHNVACHPLDGLSDPWLRRQSASFDRVLVDAPCTGTGTWRRNPDAKWRSTPEELARLVQIQAQLLDRAAALVKPGGRLVYATCSVLLEEDEDQVEAFLERHPAYARIPLAEAWAAAGLNGGPPSAVDLRLSPGRDGTDGFYAAVLVRGAR